MDEEVKAGIESFQAECERQVPGVKLVIPVRPTGGNYLISFTLEGQRVYDTIHEDDFAEFEEAPDRMRQKIEFLLKKWREVPKF